MPASRLRLAQAEQSLLVDVPGNRRLHTIGEVMQHYQVPGVSLAVIEGGEVVEARGYGVADADTGAPVVVSTPFQACSISKPVACVGMLRLVQDGRLDLDRDVNAALTSWKIPRNGDWQPRVTLRQLASHRAGLTVHGFPGYRVEDELPSLPQILCGAAPANTPGVRVDLPPGQRFRYSGGGTTVLQQLLEDVEGSGFDALMRALVLDPVGMADSRFTQPLPLGEQTGASSGHDQAGRPLPGRRRVYPELAAAGLWTTAVDLAQFLTSVQRSLHAPGGLLERELARSSVAAPLASAQDRGTLSHMGVGFFLGDVAGTRYLGHSGANAGFRCLLVGEQSRGAGLAVMTNGEGGGEVIRAISAAVATAFGWPGAGQLDFLPAAAPSPEQPAPQVPGLAPS